MPGSPLKGHRPVKKLGLKVVNVHFYNGVLYLEKMLSPLLHTTLIFYKG